jgi:hypothetical protein
MGVFSSKIKVKIHNNKRVTATEISEIIKKEVGKAGQIRKRLDETISEINKMFVELAAKHFEQLHTNFFRLEDDKVSKCAWLHTIYWFRTNNGSLFGLAPKELPRIFVRLLDQELVNGFFTSSPYDYYGWGRSLFLTDRDKNKHDEEWVDNRVNLVEIGQYFSFGLNMLDYFLTRKISELTLIEPMHGNRHTNIESKIEHFRIDRYAAIRYLEQFRSSESLLQSGHPSLLNKLENQWRIKQLEDKIENKMQIIQKELSSEEQSLVRNKQDRLNKVVAIFTGLSVVIVVSELTKLPPLTTATTDNFRVSYFTEDLFIIVVASAIALIAYIISKYKVMVHEKIRNYKYQWKIKKAINKKSEDRLKKLKYEIEGHFYYGMLTRSHFDTLHKNISEHLASYSKQKDTEGKGKKI